MPSRRAFGDRTETLFKIGIVKADPPNQPSSTHQTPLAHRSRRFSLRTAHQSKGNIPMPKDTMNVFLIDMTIPAAVAWVWGQVGRLRPPQNALYNSVYREQPKGKISEFIMSIKIEGHEYFSFKDVKARGWSPRLMARVLGPEDTSLPNPHHDALCQMRLWTASASQSCVLNS